jgi:hypothetical protein
VRFPSGVCSSSLTAPVLRVGAQGVGWQEHLDAVLAQDIDQLLGQVLVLPGQERPTTLNNGDLAAEAAKHLPELEAHIASAEHQEMIRDLV